MPQIKLKHNNPTFNSKESVESYDNSIIYKFTAQIGAKPMRQKKS